MDKLLALGDYEVILSKYIDTFVVPEDRDRLREVPIIAMTANAFAEDVQAAKTVGMNEHIAKPLDLNVLIKAMKKWIG